MHVVSYFTPLTPRSLRITRVCRAHPGLRTTSASRDAQPRAQFSRAAPVTRRSSAEAWMKPLEIH